MTTFLCPPKTKLLALYTAKKQTRMHTRFWALRVPASLKIFQGNDKWIMSVVLGTAGMLGFSDFQGRIYNTRLSWNSRSGIFREKIQFVIRLYKTHTNLRT